jgi:hypothetical protein
MRNRVRLESDLERRLKASRMRHFRCIEDTTTAQAALQAVEAAPNIPLSMFHVKHSSTFRSARANWALSGTLSARD